MKSSDQSLKWQLFIEDQYKHGETKGSRLYQMLGPYIKTREDVAFDLLCEYDLKHKRVIDLGCGEGHLVNRLSSRVSSIVGVDIARNRIDIAKNINKHNSNASFGIADLNVDLPYSDHEFDIVLCIGVLEYVIDPYAIIGEIYRILKKGGIVVISVHNIAYLPERIKLLFGGLPNWPPASGWQGGKLHDFTLPTLAGLLEGENFKVRKKTGAGFLLPLRSWWPTMLCGAAIVLAEKI